MTAAPRAAARPALGGLAILGATGFATWAGGLPVGWLVLVVALTAVILPSWIGATALTRLPAAAAAIIAAVSLIGIACSVLNLRWFANRPPALATAIAATLALVAAALVRVRRSGRADAPPAAEARPSPARPDWLLSLPLLATFAVIAVAKIRVVDPPVSWSLRGGDFMSHIALASMTERDGFLSYAHHPYPRGLHALGAWALTAWGPDLDQAPLDPWMGFWANYELFSYGLLLVAVGAVAFVVVRALGGGRSALVVAAIGVMATGFLAPFFDFTVGYGFATTIAAAWMLLALVPLGLNEAGDQKCALGSLAGSAVIVAALANTWLLLAGAPIVMCAWWLARALRTRRQHGSAPARVAAVFVAVSALAAVVPVWFTLTSNGLDQVSARGAIDPVSPVLLGSCLVALIASILVAARLGRRLPAWAPDSIVQVGWVVLVGVALVIKTGSSWHHMLYYPRKMFWYALMLSYPAAIALVAVALVWPVAVAGRRRAALAWAVVATEIVVLGGALAIDYKKDRASFADDTHLIRDLRSPKVRQRSWWTVYERSDVQDSLMAGRTVIAWQLGSQSRTALVNRAISVWPQAQMPPAAFEGAVRSKSATMCDYLRQHPGTLVLTGNPAALAASAAAGGCSPDAGGAEVVVVRRAGAGR